jgi:hypothetical protein
VSDVERAVCVRGFAHVDDCSGPHRYELVCL